MKQKTILKMLSDRIDELEADQKQFEEEIEEDIKNNEHVFNFRK